MVMLLAGCHRTVIGFVLACEQTDRQASRLQEARRIVVAKKRANLGERTMMMEAG